VAGPPMSGGKMPVRIATRGLRRPGVCARDTDSWSVLRVIHVIRATEIAGAERQLIDVLAWPDWDGFELSLRVLVGGSFDTDPFLRLREHQREVLLTPMPRDLSPNAVRAIAGDFRRHDVVHTHLVHADWHALAASPGRRAAWLTTKHNHDLFRTRRAFRAVERQVDRRADGVIAISHSLAEFTRGLSGTDVDVIHYGYAAPPEPARSTRERGPFSLLAVGRLVRQKGYDVLLRALAEIRSQQPGTALTVAGQGPERPRLERLASTLGVSESVSFAGWVRDIPALMASHDLLVHPARWEGFGVVLLEAMRARLPIVASAVGAIPEVIAEGGILVPAERPEALAAAVTELLAAPGERSRLADTAARRLEKEFAMGRAVEALSRLYRSVG
jgi:glycosyltransferase involved in cell wall biosynthesis